MNFKLTVSKAGFAIKKNMPVICLVGSGVSTVLAIASAIKATNKLNTELESYKEDLAKNKRLLEESKGTENEKYARKNYAVSAMKAYSKIALAYTPTALFAVSSIVLSGKSYSIMSDRLGSAVAYGTATAKAFADYRKKTKELIGEEEEKKISNGISSKEITEEVEDEKGNKKEEKKTVYSIPEKPADYKVVFEKGLTDEWSPSNNQNRLLFSAIEDEVNRKLKYKHFIRLNGIMKLLGLEERSFGDDYGYIYDPNKEHQFTLADRVEDVSYYKGEVAYAINFNDIVPLFSVKKKYLED